AFFFSFLFYCLRAHRDLHSFPYTTLFRSWFVDSRLSGTWGASVLGLAVDPSGRELYFAAGNQEPGIVIYRLPFAHPDGAHLQVRSEEHTSELQSRFDLVCRLLLEKKKHL